MVGPRPVFCGNFEYDASPTEIERLFRKYGKLERVDMKTGSFMLLKPIATQKDVPG